MAQRAQARNASVFEPVLNVIAKYYQQSLYASLRQYGAFEKTAVFPSVLVQVRMITCGWNLIHDRHVFTHPVLFRVKVR